MAIPIAILAGSDPAPARLPEAGRHQRSLSGYKGRDLTVDGQPLLHVLLDVVRASGLFEPLYVVGPSRVYGDLGATAELIDADGSLGANVTRAVELLRARHPDTPLTFSTCDVVPTVSALEALMDAYTRAAPCDMCFPLVRVPAERSELGASGWKPVYRLAGGRARDPIPVLPGHIVIADPAGLRLPLIYRLLDIAYRTRNQSIGERRSTVALGVLATLLREDVGAACTLRPPTATWSVLTQTIAASRRLEAGTLGLTELEDVLRVVFTHEEHRRRHPARRVVLPLLDELSMALDIDTEEEAKESGFTT